MTPAARLETAAGLLDDIIAGNPTERCLTRWSRQSRYAGSRDRAAVRDLVFDCLRQRRSFLWRSGQEIETGRALLIGHQVHTGTDLDAIFDGSDYGPEALSDAERTAIRPELSTAPLPVALDFPDFLEEELKRSLGDDLARSMHALQHRAPVDLRVNTLKSTRDVAQTVLAQDDIKTVPITLAETALRVTENPRRVANSRAYKGGFVELQDASSQAVSLAAKVQPGMRVLDYCAGGGGKTLALAALMRGQGQIDAHDSRPARMNDISARAKRAGVKINKVTTEQLSHAKGIYDLVLVDAPCSGSGAWRRNPDSKWRLTDARLRALSDLQSEILNLAIPLVKPGGRLIYATCSIFSCENRDVIAAFLEGQPNVSLLQQTDFPVSEDGDGFHFTEMLTT